MLTKVLLICTQGYYKSDSKRPRITKISNDEDSSFPPGHLQKKVEDWQDKRRIYNFTIPKFSTCAALKNQIANEFYLPQMHMGIYFNDQKVEEGICI